MHFGMKVDVVDLNLKRSFFFFLYRKNKMTSSKREIDLILQFFCPPTHN